jgi:hypothetical protein
VNLSLVSMRGMVAIRVVRHILIGKISPMLEVCVTCIEMGGNGCRMSGIMIMTALLMIAVPGKVKGAPARSFAMVSSTSSPGSAIWRFARSTTLATATTTRSFVISSSLSCRKYAIQDCCATAWIMTRLLSCAGVYRTKRLFPAASGRG